MTDTCITRDALLAENATLHKENAALGAPVVQLGVPVTTLLARVAALERRESPPWVEPNRPVAPLPRPARKRRSQHFARRRDAATATVLHQWCDGTRRTASALPLNAWVSCCCKA